MSRPIALESILARHPAGRRDALVPLLCEVQTERGWLAPEDIERIANHVGVPGDVAWSAVRLAGTFRFEPPGRWPIRVCVGTSCQVRGANATLAALEGALGVPAGRTTADGACSLDAVACFGACSFAPVVEVRGELRFGLDASAVPRLLEELHAVRFGAGGGRPSGRSA
jgi:NADH:ubiquinone oxidoreductase subunit E